jgi:DNA ligase-1
MRVLQASANVPLFKEILQFIYNPYLRTGISDKKLDSRYNGSEGLFRYLDETSLDCAGIMRYLAANNTGSDKDVWVALKFIERVKDEMRHDTYAVKIARAIVTQDLQIGVTATTLNKVFGADFIPRTGCMLGTLYGKIPAHKLKWPYIVTEKLDGIRRVIIKEDGVSRAYSRSGHEDVGLVEIMEDMKWLPDNAAYDGELIAIGLFRDSIAKRQATSSLSSQSGLKRGLIFNVFDMLPLEEFRAGASKATAINRKIRLGATLMDESIKHIDDDWYRRIQAFGIHRKLQFIKPVPILGLAHRMSDVEPIVEEIWNRRDEGVMLNSTTGLYEIKRSKELLKLKHTEEFVLEVIGVQEGDNKYEDMMGALIVNYKGNAVGVGTGFSDDLRGTLWRHQADVIGRKVEIESFGESTNAAGQVSLNCPVFLRFVDEVHE